MKLRSLLPAAAFATFGLAGTALAEPGLTEVASFTEMRPGNVAVALDGRIFVSMQPLDGPTYRVVEVKAEGTLTPFPTEDWADGPAGEVGFAAVIGIAAGSDGTIWMLDMGGPETPPKLVGWDTGTNSLAANIPIPADVVVSNSFLQDFALDEDRGVAIIADMTLGNLAGDTRPALIVVDLETSEARRLLEGHQTFLPSATPVEINGQRLINLREDGTEVDLRFGLNPIAIDPAFEWVYYGTISGTELYRVPAAMLADPEVDEDALAAAIEPFGEKSPSDGIVVDGEGRVFVTDIVASAVGIATAGGYSILVQDERLSWPDGFAFGPDGALYVTQNDLHLHPAFNRGQEGGTPPYGLFRIAPADLATNN
jgi:hypothetical protein